MPKIAKALGPLAVSRLKTSGYHAVGGVRGLYLQVVVDKDAKDKITSRTWIMRTMIGEKRREVGLGPYPETSLERAREKAVAAREQIQAGIDPIAERRAAASKLRAERDSQMTFRQAAEKYVASRSAAWTNKKHAAQWETTLAAYAHPKIGDLLVRDVGEGHVLAILEPIWATKHETAVKVRQRIELVMDYATARKWRTGANPARFKGNLEYTLAPIKRAHRIQHFPSLPPGKVGAFMAALRKVDGMSARCLELCVLTGLRSGEVRRAEWSEIDLDAKVWTVPKERFGKDKNRKLDHRVPLSDSAVRLLEALPHREGFVFPGRTGKAPLSDMSLSMLIERMNQDPAAPMQWVDPDQKGRGVVPHGFRATLKTWARAKGAYPQEVVEEALAHVIQNKTESAYIRADMFERRVPLMADWAKWCDAIQPAKGNVTDMSEARQKREEAAA